MLDYQFQGNLKEIQNNLISQSIRETSNLELLKSDEAIRTVIQSYIDKFNVVEGKLTNVAKHLITSKSPIRIQQFNDLFQSIYIDLYSLYSNIELVDKVLSLNLYRNKNFFSVLKKRTKDLWNRLFITRMNIFDTKYSTESFFESFSSNVGLKDVINLSLDKKSGFIYLKPLTRQVYNSPAYIKSITSVIYPEDNTEGGVTRTTSILNTFDDNYSTGSKDMLQNGLWKEELLCNDIPDMIINIGSDSNPIRKDYKGIVSLVDIEFTSILELNRFDFDIFGDMKLDIDTILYKDINSEEWIPIVNELKDNENTYQHISGSAFDVLNFINISSINTKYIRIVFNQQNYTFIDSDTSGNTLQDKIFTDFSERRYELVKFGTSLDQVLSVPVNDENTSLYSKIVNIIESTQDVEKILRQIINTLNPDSQIKITDFSKLIKFELGTWSIEPTLEKYTHFGGSFNTIPYSLKDKPLISASINTSQSVPGSCTCNWYINLDNITIPVVENDEIWRKEPINIINPSYIPSFSNWSGLFISLDFPVDPYYAEGMEFYINGEKNTDIVDSVVFLNSKLLYIHQLEYTNQHVVIKYPVAMYSSVTVYVLSKATPDVNTISVVSSMREPLEFLVNNYPGFKNQYAVVNTIATIHECKDWFGTNFSNSIFMDQYSTFNLESFSLKNYIKNSISFGATKLHASIEDVESYLVGVNESFKFDPYPEDNVIPFIVTK